MAAIESDRISHPVMRKLREVSGDGYSVVAWAAKRAIGSWIASPSRSKNPGGGAGGELLGQLAQKLWYWQPSVRCRFGHGDHRFKTINSTNLQRGQRSPRSTMVGTRSRGPAPRKIPELHAGGVSLTFEGEQKRGRERGSSIDVPGLLGLDAGTWNLLFRSPR